MSQPQTFNTSSFNIQRYAHCFCSHVFHQYFTLLTDFTSKGGTSDYVTFYYSGAFWSGSKRKTGRTYFLQEIKSCLEFLINNSFFQVGSKFFCQTIDIPMGSDPVLFFSNLFYSFVNLDGKKFIKNTYYGFARTFGNIFRFIDDLIAIRECTLSM